MGQAKLCGLLAMVVALVLGSAPAREEKSDCEDCVLVLREATIGPQGSPAGSSGMSGASTLAGTLWGLFMVSRPKRLPRTFIRGVTVP